jgi:hypothetical protein
LGYSEMNIADAAMRDMLWRNFAQRWGDLRSDPERVRKLAKVYEASPHTIEKWAYEASRRGYLGYNVCHNGEKK